MRNKKRSNTALILAGLICLAVPFLSLAAERPPARPKVRVPILMYHHTRTPGKNDVLALKDLSCSLTSLERHCAYLKRNGYTTIHFQDLFEHLQNDIPLPEKPVILSFDDGYKDNWDAYRTLRKLNMKGVFFVVLRTLGDAKHLSKTQLLAMSRDGMEIASHSLHHYDLTKLSEQRAEQEILQSKEALELFLGRPVFAFCYPGGKHDKKTLRILERSTYWFARTTRPGTSTVSGKNFTLKTIRIHDHTGDAALSQAMHTD